MQNIENLLLFSGEDYLRVSKGLVRTLGVECAFMFAELVDEYLYYYKQKYDVLEQNNGWFYSTADNIKERTSWSADKQEKIIKILIEKNLIQKKIAGVPAKRFFYINSKEAQNLVTQYQETSFRKKRQLDSAKNGNLYQENTETIINISKEGNLKTKSKEDKKSASGFSSFKRNYSEIPNSSVSSILEHTQKQDSQQDYILNTSKKSVAQHLITLDRKPCILEEWDTKSGVNTGCGMQIDPRRKNAEFEEFWNLYGKKVKKPKAEESFKKALKTKDTTFQSIMNGAKKYNEYLNVATWCPKAHPTSWLNEGRWNDDYEDLIKQEYKKNNKTPPVAQKSPEKQQEEVKMNEDKQKKRESVIKHLNSDETQFMNYIKEVLKPYFTELHKSWINDFVFSCRNKVAYFGFTEQKNIDTVDRNFVKFEQIILREIASTVLVKQGGNLKIELKLID